MKGWSSQACHIDMLVKIYQVVSVIQWENCPEKKGCIPLMLKQLNPEESTAFSSFPFLPVGKLTFFVSGPLENYSFYILFSFSLFKCLCFFFITSHLVFFFFLPLIRDNEMKMMIINLGKTNYKPKKQFSSVLAQYTEENKMYFTWIFLVSLFEILFNYQTQRRCLCTIGDRERTSRSSSLQMRDKTLQFPYLELKKVKPICSEYIWFIHMCISSHSGHYACNIRKGMSQAADSRKSSV